MCTTLFSSTWHGEVISSDITTTSNINTESMLPQHSFNMNYRLPLPILYQAVHTDKTDFKSLYGETLNNIYSRISSGRSFIVWAWTVLSSSFSMKSTSSALEELFGLEKRAKLFILLHFLYRGSHVCRLLTLAEVSRMILVSMSPAQLHRAIGARFHRWCDPL